MPLLEINPNGSIPHYSFFHCCSAHKNGSSGTHESRGFKFWGGKGYSRTVMGDGGEEG